MLPKLAKVPLVFKATPARWSGSPSLLFNKEQIGGEQRSRSPSHAGSIYLANSVVPRTIYSPNLCLSIWRKVVGMLHMLTSEHQLVSNKRHRLEWFTFHQFTEGGRGREDLHSKLFRVPMVFETMPVRLPSSPSTKWYAPRESNAETTGSKPARYASSLQVRIVWGDSRDSNSYLLGSQPRALSH